MPSKSPSASVAAPVASKTNQPAASAATAKAATPNAGKTPSQKKAVLVKKPVAEPVSAVKARPASDKRLKPKKIKMVSDSFTIPKLEYLMLETLKLRAGALGHSVKKSELIRAGIKALSAMPDGNFEAALKTVQTHKN